MLKRLGVLINSAGKYPSNLSSQYLRKEARIAKYLCSMQVFGLTVENLFFCKEEKMENSFLNDLSFDPGYIIMGMIALVVVLIALVIFLLVKYDSLQKSYDNFMKGRNGNSLEEVLIRVVDDNKKVKQQCKNNIDAILDMKKEIKHCYKKMGIVRYDTFNENSGKLSFVLALLDENDNGILLNSIHSSNGSYQYLKTISNGVCELTLSEEEDAALEKAIEWKETI